MSTITQTTSADKLSLMHGLLISLISVVLSVVFWLIDPLLQFTSWWLGLLTFAVVIVLLIVLAIDIRKKIGGFWSFGEAFKSLFIMSAIIITINTAYSFVLFKFIDPDLPEKVNTVMIDKMNTALSNAGLDQAKIDESTKSFTNGEFKAKLEPNLKNEAMALGGGLLFYVIVDLIVAASIKKTAPLFAPLTDEETTT